MMSRTIISPVPRVPMKLNSGVISFSLFELDLLGGGEVGKLLGPWTGPLHDHFPKYNSLPALSTSRKPPAASAAASPVVRLTGPGRAPPHRGAGPLFGTP